MNIATAADVELCEVEAFSPAGARALSLAVLTRAQPELAQVVSRWPELPGDVRREVLALIERTARAS